MRRSLSLVCSHLFRPVRLALVFLGIPALVAAQQILETYSATLTTYLAGKTGVQDAKPLPEQRGVNLDGTTRRGSALPITLGGNGFETPSPGQSEVNGVRLDTGTYSPTEVDFSLPAPGFPWVVGRTYNARQTHSGSQYNSDGIQGFNWHQLSQPEIVLYDDNDNTQDVLYLVYGSDRYVEFQRTGSSATTYKGKNGAAGIFEYVSGSPDTWKLHDPSGVVVTFLGFNTGSGGSTGPCDGQLWKIEDPAANVAYVGSTTLSSVTSSGYDTSGRMTTAYDTAGRRYTYSYSSSTIGGKKRLQSVVAEVYASQTWSEVGRVEYDYFPDGSTSNGLPGDLRYVTTTMPLSDSGVNDVRVQYYRYYTLSYENSEGRRGYPHSLLLVVGREGARQYEYLDSNFTDGDLDADSLTSIKPYGSAYFEYDTSHRIDVAWFNGQCGCGSSGSGVYSITYESCSYTNTSGYDNVVARRVVIDQPDTAYVTQYFDETGQAMAHVVHTGVPTSSPAPTSWVTWVKRDGMGCVDEVLTPEAVASYTHSSSSITEDSSGLVHVYDRVASGDAKGFWADHRYRNGSSGSEYYLSSTVYWTSTATKSVGSLTLTRPLLKEAWNYPDATTTQHATGANKTAYSYTTYSGATPSQPLAIETQTETLPAVSTSKNGSGSSHTVSTHLRKDALMDFRVETDDAGDSIVEYRTYTNGQVTQLRRDADTTNLSPPSGFSSSGTELVQTESFSYDAQGRAKFHTEPDGRKERVYYSKLADRRSVTVRFPRFTPSESQQAPEDEGTYCGPATFQVGNHSCGTEAQGTIVLTETSEEIECSALEDLAAFIDESSADPIAAIDGGNVAAIQTTIFDSSGNTSTASRSYSAIPSSLPGTDGTHYDETAYAYDAFGRNIRTKESHGTIYRMNYDERGNVISRSEGTNDYGSPKGESSGPNNMTTVEETVFDTNGYVTKFTAYVEDSATDKRETNYYNDIFGRAAAVASSAAPHSVNGYDNLGRVTATARYSSSSGLSASSTPTTATNRMSYSETSYDERGRVWKSTRHKIDASDGSDDDSLDALSWYDKLGRLAKRDGETLEKFKYDRLGRRTHRFVLASDDDGTTYTNMVNVTGDFALEEHQSVLDIEGREQMSVRLFRNYNNYGTGQTAGALDANNDGDALAVDDADIGLQGTTPPLTPGGARVQITANWFDELGRIEDTVEYGTNHATANSADFDRDGLTVPARSDTALRTTYGYDLDGRLDQITDPKGLVTRYEHDAAGRRTKVIENYTSGGTPGSPNADSNQTVVYAYTDGLQVSITADLPTGESDQVTTYTFGTTKGTGAGDSKVATGHLLKKVQYPDSSDATNDIVAFAYNAQGERIWQRDQATPTDSTDYNIIETEHDLAGREAHRRVTQKRSAVDGAVRRISTTYDGLGRTQLVTQYTAATGGNVVDEVKYTYDGWGLVSKFEQDPDSAVASGAWSVEYGNAKVTGGRNTLRRTKMTLPDGYEVDYTYRSTGGRLDADASRVSQVTDVNGTALASYQYNGVGMVVRTDLDEAEAYSKLYGAAASFGALDRFDRTIISRWTKDLASNDPEFYKVTLSYDRNSNITLQDDAIHSGHDVAYSNDNLNRLTVADEGTWNGSAITSRTRKQEWVLNQTGNWNTDKVDLNGDGDWGDTNELNDTRVHNTVNELSTRDTDSNSSVNYTFAYDAAGNMTNDGEMWKYEWDAFGRLRKVRNQSDTLVSEYWYNGLGFLITRHQDTDTDGDVDSNDKKYHSVYDERWRPVATYRESDTSPKERFIYHAAGNGGFGGSSYIDTALLRDKDASTAWTAASDGALDERLYYCQNWRADVVALLNAEKGVVEWVKYSAYGVPFAMPKGDANSDGACNSTDDGIVNGWTSSGYDVRGDLDLDGDVDSGDYAAVQTAHQTLGRGVLTSVGNRKGYAGYEFDWYRGRQYHVRHRIFDPILGRWLRRDPLVYADGPNALAYASAQPMKNVDWTGLQQDYPLSDSGWVPGGWFREPPRGFTPATPCTPPSGMNYVSLSSLLSVSTHYVVDGNAPTGPNCCFVAYLQGRMGHSCCDGARRTICIITANIERRFKSARTAGVVGRVVRAHEQVHADNLECVFGEGFGGAPHPDPRSFNASIRQWEIELKGDCDAECKKETKELRCDGPCKQASPEVTAGSTACDDC